MAQHFAEQFWRWLTAFLRGDWGHSFATGRPVATKFAARLPWSLAIGIGGPALAALLGFGLGFAAARRPGGSLDGLSRALAVAGQALPAFAVGLLLLWLGFPQLVLRHRSVFGHSIAEPERVDCCMVAWRKEPTPGIAAGAISVRLRSLQPC